MIKYTEEFKLSVVKHYLTGTVGFKSVGHYFGVAPPIVRRWVMWFRQHGADGLSRKKSSYSPEFKLSVLQHMWDNALSHTQTAAVFNVRNVVSIGIWERRFHSGGIEALARTTRRKTDTLAAPTSKPLPSSNDKERSREELLAELEYLRMENAVLKKLQALAQARKKAAAPTKR